MTAKQRSNRHPGSNLVETILELLNPPHADPGDPKGHDDRKQLVLDRLAFLTGYLQSNPYDEYNGVWPRSFTREGVAHLRGLVESSRPVTYTVHTTEEGHRHGA